MSSIGVETDIRVVVLVGSVRSGRFGALVGDWVHKSLAEENIDVDLIDLFDLTIPQAMIGHPDVDLLAERISRADAIVIVTPEYNHSYPGPLKSAVDALREQWQAKPVSFVSYGGMSGGLRAVEALRLVFAELHAVTVRETVSLHNPWGPAGDPNVDYPDHLATEALRRMLRQLLWWAQTLRAGRDRIAYPA